jgi:uncharacterized protein YxjI
LDFQISHLALLAQIPKSSIQSKHDPTLYAPAPSSITNLQPHPSQKEIFSFPKSYFAESPTGAKIFEVEGKFHLGTSKAVGHFTNAMNGEKENFLMHGSFFNAKTEIVNERDGQVVAQVDREFLNARQLLADRQSYAITVAPGVDVALIVAMVVCLDERRDQKTGHYGI